MKSLLSFLLLVIPVITGFAQSNKVPKSPYLFTDWRPGFVSITELTGGLGLSETSVPYANYYYGVTTMAGYQFTRNIKACAGLGVHMYDDGPLFPVFADARYSFNAQKVVPFISASGGLLLNPRKLDDTWVYINPALGVRYVASNKFGFSFSAGIFTMSGESNRNSFVNFKLGFEFKGK